MPFREGGEWLSIRMMFDGHLCWMLRGAWLRHAPVWHASNMYPLFSVNVRGSGAFKVRIAQSMPVMGPCSSDMSGTIVDIQMSQAPSAHSTVVNPRPRLLTVVFGRVLSVPQNSGVLRG